MTHERIRPGASLRRIIQCALAAAWVACFAPAANAEWELRERANGQPPIATVRSESGEVLRVLVSPQSSVVVGTLMLPPGLAPLDPAGCPTFQVDTREPGSLADEGSCSVNGRSVTFVLGAAQNQRIKSRALREMMGGRSLMMTYRYEKLGYGAVKFVLRGSLATLLGALNGWKVDGAP